MGICDALFVNFFLQTVYSVSIFLFSTNKPCHNAMKNYYYLFYVFEYKAIIYLL